MSGLLSGLLSVVNGGLYNDSSTDSTRLGTARWSTGVRILSGTRSDLLDESRVWHQGVLVLVHFTVEVRVWKPRKTLRRSLLTR